MSGELDLYRLMSWVYDGLGWAYSGGQQQACKEAFVRGLQPGAHVLFAGPGTGGDVLAAAKTGAQVCAVERSRAMASRLRRRVVGAQNVEVIEADVLTFERPAQFDWIFANFFLNVFSPVEMERVLAHLATLLRPGGKLVIGDFAPLAPGPIRILQWLYYYLPLIVFCLFTRNALHDVYDYRPSLARAQLELSEVRRYRAFRWGPAWYAALLTIKRG